MGLFYDPPQPASAADYTRFRDAHLAANLSPNDANLAAAVAMGLIGARRGPPKGWSRVRRGSAIRTSPRWRKRTGQPPPGVAARAVIDSTPLPKFAECLPREYALLTVAARLRYSVSRHSGAASMRVIADGTSTIALLVRGESAGHHQLHRIQATFYAAAACTGNSVSPAGASTSSPSIDGGWHSITGQTTASAETMSARIQLNFVCVLATCKTSADPGAPDRPRWHDELVRAGAGDLDSRPPFAGRKRVTQGRDGRR